MPQPLDPSIQPTSLRLASGIAAARSFSDLERLRQEYLAKADLKPEELKLLETALAMRERDLIEFYSCQF